MIRKLNVFDISTIDALLGFAAEIAGNREELNLTIEQFLKMARENAAQRGSRKG